MVRLITNKIDAIKQVREFVHQTLGTVACLKHSKEFVDNLIEENKKAAALDLSKFVMELIPGKTTFDDYEVEAMRGVVEEAFKIATGREIFIGTVQTATAAGN